MHSDSTFHFQLSTPPTQLAPLRYRGIIHILPPGTVVNKPPDSPHSAVVPKYLPQPDRGSSHRSNRRVLSSATRKLCPFTNNPSRPTSVDSCGSPVVAGFAGFQFLSNLQYWTQSLVYPGTGSPNHEATVIFVLGCPVAFTSPAVSFPSRSGSSSGAKVWVET
jgi:hypothetical protein